MKPNTIDMITNLKTLTEMSKRKMIYTTP